MWGQGRLLPTDQGWQEPQDTAGACTLQSISSTALSVSPLAQVPALAGLEARWLLGGGRSCTSSLEAALSMWIPGQAEPTSPLAPSAVG